MPDCSHAPVIGRVRSFRGIETLTAAGLCAETGGFGRFPRPTLLSGFLGIVPSERTSDTKRRQGSITKAGSPHARRLLVEAAHHYRKQPAITQTLARRQEGQDPRVIEIAWRAQRRLHHRWQHLHHERKSPPASSRSPSRVTRLARQFEKPFDRSPRLPGGLRRGLVCQVGLVEGPSVADRDRDDHLLVHDKKPFVGWLKAAPNDRRPARPPKARAGPMILCAA